MKHQRTEETDEGRARGGGPVSRIVRFLPPILFTVTVACKTTIPPIEIDLSKQATPTATPEPIATPAPPTPRAAAKPPAPTSTPTAPAPSPTPAPASPPPAAPTPGPTTIESVVDAQNDAFNRHDLEALSSLYAPDAVLLDYPDHARHTGSEEIRASYAKGFADSPAMRVRVDRRLAQGDYLFDQETISGLAGGATISLVAIYEVRGGRIRRVWYVR